MDHLKTPFRQAIRFALISICLLNSVGGPASAERQPRSLRQPHSSPAIDRVRSDGMAAMSTIDRHPEARVQRARGRLPLRFEANVGQADSQVKFYSRGSGYNLFLTPTEAVLALRNEKPRGAYRQFISRARLKGLKVIGGALPPFEGTIHFTQAGAQEGESIRQAVNEFIRHGGEFDEVVDFDLALRDPSRPTRLLPLYDSGDHLHPNDAGYEAMANAVDLRIFDRRFGRRAGDTGRPESDQF